jgi:hypothetical protein
MMKLPIIALSGTGKGWWGGGDGGDNLSNVQCKAIQNCHSKFSLYNEYMLMKVGKKKSGFVLFHSPAT